MLFHYVSNAQPSLIDTVSILRSLDSLGAVMTSTHEAFRQILLDGKLSYFGMANFSDVLKEEEVEAVHQYHISVQKERFEKNEVKDTIGLRTQP